MRRWLATLLLTLAFAGAATADGPETGVVSGVVTAGGQALAGIKVSIEGNRGSRDTVTEEGGVYRFALLPPGAYTVRAEMDQFTPAQSPVEVTAGGKAEVNLAMSLSETETITVVSDVPLVDKYNVSVGSSVKADVAAEVSPAVRGIYGSIALLPGVTNDDTSLDIDGARPSFNGTTWIESSVFIDGVDATFTRYGATRMFLPTSATSEIDVTNGGSSSSYGRVVGGVTNVIVKSGTNKFHGDFKAIHTNLAWNANYKEHLEYERHPTRPRLRDHFKFEPGDRDGANKTAHEASLGGPILRNKAWFFIATSERASVRLDKTVGSPAVLPPSGECGIEEQRSGECIIGSDLVPRDRDVESYIAKFNFQPGSNHQVAVSWISTPVNSVFQLTNMADRYVPTDHRFDGSLVSGTWNWSVNRRAFLETKLAKQTSNEDKRLNVPGVDFDLEAALAFKQQDPRFAPQPGLDSPHAPVNNFSNYIDFDGTWHNGWLLDNGIGTNEYPRDQVNSALTVFTSNEHELKFGVDFQETEWDQNVFHNDLYVGGDFDPFDPDGYAGFPFWYRDYNPSDVVAEGKGTGRTVSQNLALYGSDRFSLGDRWTFNLGLRIEDQNHKNDIGREVIKDTDFSPRITAVYDLKADGKMLLTGSVGRYFTYIPQETINTFLLDEWNGFNAYDQYYTDFVAFTFLGAPAYTELQGSLRPGRLWELIGEDELDISSYGRDEAILGFEWQFSKSWAVNAKAIYWETFDQLGNTTQLDPVTGGLFTLSANLEDYPRILRSLGWVEAFASPGCLSTGEACGTAAEAEAILNNFADANRNYKGLQLQLNRRFGKGWAVFNSVTLAETEGSSFGANAFNNTNDSYGELLHLVLQEQDITDCQSANANTRQDDFGSLPDCEALRPFLGQPLSTINREGRATREKPIIFRTYGFKVWNLGKHSFTLGGQLTGESGVRWNFTQTGAQEANQGGNRAIDDDVTLYVEERGVRVISGRWFANLSGSWAFPLGRAGLEGRLRLEVNNVTDNQNIVGLDRTSGFINSGRRSFASPRSMRLLGEVSF